MNDSEPFRPFIVLNPNTTLGAILVSALVTSACAVLFLLVDNQRILNHVG